MKRLRTILRLTTCPQCGYDLRELPSEHACPECGYAYTEDMSMIPVLKKEEVPRVFLLVLWLVMTVLFSVIALAGFISIVVVTFSGGAPRMGIFIYVLVMGGCAGGCSLSVREQWRGRRLVKTGMIEPTHALILSRKGYYLRGMHWSGEWTNWSGVPEAFLKRRRKGLWRLRLKTSWWRTLFSRHVDVFIKASPREAAAVRGRIRMFMKESRDNHQVELKKAMLA